MPEKRNTRICAICGSKCDSTTHLYSVPKDDHRLLEWVISCGQLLHPKSLVCSKHFQQNASGNKKLKKGDVPSVCPKKEVIPLPVQRLEEPTPVANITTSLVNTTPPIDSTYYIREHEVERVYKCCACMESLPNELYSASVTMLCYDDKTVKDALQLILVPQLHQKEYFDGDAIKYDDFVCDSCFMVLRNTLKFVKKCLEIREQMKDQFQNEKMKQVVKIRKKEVAKMVPDLHYGSFLPLRYSKMPDHDAVVSFKDAVPECLISLQQNGVNLLQNCKSYENFYENKRVLLVGSRTYLNCPRCDELFVSKERKINHYAEVHNLSKAYLMEPIHYEYEPNDSNECQGCGKVFFSTRSRNVHLSKCKMFACPYCDGVFNGNKMSEHTKQAHGDANPFKCDKCKLESWNYHGLRSHICNGRMCEHCGRTYFYKSRYVEHKKKFCRMKTCRECKKKISVTLYDKHKESHNNFPCPKCGMVFKSRYAMKKHVNRHKTSLCPICGKECKILATHMLTHDENRTKNIPCNQCPKLFYRITEMQRHVKKDHCEMIICEICGEQVRKYYMKNHHMVKHTTTSNTTATSTPKEYKCETCSQSFENTRAFKLHVRRHTGFLEMRRKNSKKYDFRKNDPVFCKHCLKSFKNVVYLEKHMKTHTNSCRVRCRYCSNTYANVKCRWKHEMRHHKVTGEKQRKALPGFKKTSESNICTCEVCGELFQNVDLLNVHKEEFHNLTKLSNKVVDDLAKEMLLSFETLECDESLFFREESVLADNVEIVVSYDSDHQQ
ncbi:unnamed protein product [Phaedon cochleariae]|uniref:Zinc finger protein n=1 Tax=Phaedon cochleariae TaxID=80249 RepID=A0A9P0DHI1_PHACE|nr:unnamed protein product [Phaedon cochleariae]